MKPPSWLIHICHGIMSSQLFEIDHTANIIPWRWWRWLIQVRLMFVQLPLSPLAPSPNAYNVRFEQHLWSASHWCRCFRHVRGFLVHSVFELMDFLGFSVWRVFRHSIISRIMFLTNSLWSFLWVFHDYYHIKHATNLVVSTGGSVAVRPLTLSSAIACTCSSRSTEYSRPCIQHSTPTLFTIIP